MEHRMSLVDKAELQSHMRTLYMRV